MRMNPYPSELRQRVVDAIDNSLGTYEEIGEMFGVSQFFIYKLLRQRRHTGAIAPRPHSGGAKPKLKQSHLDVLTDLVATHPDATLDELRENLRKKTRNNVSISTICRVLTTHQITRKKRVA